MSRRTRQTAAGLLVVCAALFIIGVTAESDTHAETEAATDHDQATESAGGEANHDEVHCQAFI